MFPIFASNAAPEDTVNLIRYVHSMQINYDLEFKFLNIGLSSNCGILSDFVLGENSGFFLKVILTRF